MRKAINLTSPYCMGVMSAEGILRNPALFKSYVELTRLDDQDILAADCCENPTDLFYHCNKCEEISRKRDSPDLLSLFDEYCTLSEKYRVLGGWNGMDSYEIVKRGESKQIYVARQHLTWMLGKQGHGRSVRFKHKSEAYMKHCALLNELNSATSICDLLSIARKCLGGVYG